MSEPNKKPVVFQVIGSLIVGGAERVVLNLLLNHERFTPVCVALREPANSLYEQILAQEGIPIHYLHMRRAMDLNALKRMNQLFRHYRPKVVHCHLRGLVYAYPLMILHRTPVRVYTVHNVSQYDIGARWSVIVQKLAFRYGIGRVVPVSIAEEVKRSVVELFGYERSPIIFNGIPVEEFTPSAERRMRWRAENGFEQNAILLVHVARYDPRKNQPLLVRVAGQLKAKVPLYLLMVGTSGTAKEIQDLIDELNLRHRVKTLGIREDLADILIASDIFVFPSVSEGNPMAIQEAMAAGLPIASTTVGGIPELVGHGEAGLLCEPNDEEGFRAIVQQLIDSPEMRQRMGQKALQRAHEQCSAKAMTQRYEQLYQAILSGEFKP